MAEGFDDLTHQERAEAAAQAWEEFWGKMDALGFKTGFCTAESIDEKGRGFAPLFAAGEAGRIHWIAALGMQQVVMQTLMPPPPPKSPLVLAPAQAGLKAH